MSTPVPFGQYAPGDSPVHRLDARTKLGVTFAYTIALFAVSTWAGLALAGLVAAIAVLTSGVELRLVLRGLRPIGWLLAFTLAVNALTWGASDVIPLVGPLGIDPEGLRRGAFFAARIVLLVSATSLVTLTSSPVALTDALGQIMRPLSVVRFPVDDVAMMLSIALRFLPTTAEEAERIVVAQTARGARFDRGGLVSRARAWVPVLVPLFVRLFRRADDLAVAMESRCYTGVGRSRLRDPRMAAADWATLGVGMTVCTAMAILL